VLNKRIEAIVKASRKNGWVLEPDAKKIFQLAGMLVPRFRWAKHLKEAVEAASEIGYPVVGKIVSPKILHKSDEGGVVTGINTRNELERTFEKFKSFRGFDGMLVEETVVGTELIFGAKMDYQFGPVVLLGIGGTGVEIYRDISIRMTPITGNDVLSMIRGLKARQLIEGYRSNPPVNIDKLSETMLKFSEVVMKLESDFQSIDLNPVMCTTKDCIVVDARIILK